MLIIWVSQQRDTEWSPSRLGSKLLAWWDVETSSSLTLSGSQIAGWEDKVTGADLTQGIGGSRPVYQATGFNGRPAAYFDGVDDYLELATAGSFLPLAASACEMYTLADAPSFATDSSSVRNVFAYGNTLNTGRRLRRFISGSQSLFSPEVGDGTGRTAVTVTSTPFVGPYLGIARVGASATTARLLPGGTDVTASVVPGTVAGRTRIGANSAATPASFWLNKVNTIIVTGTLTTDERTLLETYLQGRL